METDLPPDPKKNVYVLCSGKNYHGRKKLTVVESAPEMFAQEIFIFFNRTKTFSKKKVLPCKSMLAKNCLIAIILPNTILCVHREKYIYPDVEQLGGE